MHMYLCNIKWAMYVCMYVCMYLSYEAQHSKYIRYLSYEVVSIRNCVGSVRSGMQACGVKRK